MDASDDDIQITVVYPPKHGFIRRTAIDRHRFTMADVKDGSVTYEHTGNNSHDDFRFVVRFGAVESTGSVVVHVTNATSQTPAPNVLRIVTNVVAVVDELGAVQLSQQVLKVDFVLTITATRAASAHCNVVAIHSFISPVFLWASVIISGVLFSLLKYIKMHTF